MKKSKIKGIIFTTIGLIGGIAGSIILPIAMHSKKEFSFVGYNANENKTYKVNFQIGVGIYNLNLIYNYEINNYKNELNNADLENIKNELNDRVNTSKQENKYQISEWYYNQFIKDTQENYKKILNESNYRYNELESQYNNAKDEYLNYKGDVTSPDYQEKKLIYVMTKASIDSYNESDNPYIEEYKNLVDTYKLFYILRILGIMLIPLFSIVLFIGLLLLFNKKSDKNKTKINSNKLELDEKKSS